MLETALQRGIRFGYVGIDGGHGKDATFLHDVDNLGCTFVADVHCRQMIYCEDPEPHIPVWNGRSRQPKHLKTQSDAIRDQWASVQPDTAWQRIKLREGKKGSLAEVNFMRWFGHGMAARNKSIVGACWSGKKSAQAKYRIIVYQTRHLKRRYKN